jgi:excisionase family DNA binding protein
MPSNVKENPMLLTVSQAAELLQLGRDTMYQLTHVDGFPAIRLGRAVRINRAALQAWLDQNNGGILL